MSEFILKPTPLQFTDQPAPLTGSSLKNLKDIQIGSGEGSVIVLDIEGAKFGSPTLTNANAYIKLDGTYKFKDGSGNTIMDITGVQIDGISGLPSIQGWTSTLTLSATDHDTVAWTSGSIILTDGTTYSISAGNTGTMAAVTYIYLDIDTSTTVLQTTTTAATSVGANKILIAVAQNVASGKKATFQAFGGEGGVGTLITADNIAANTITANELAANSITASEISTGAVGSTKLDGTIISGGKIITGLLTADNIQAGTLTGRTVQATNVTTGANVKVDSVNRRISWLYDNSEKGYITANSSGYLLIDADTAVKIQATGSGDDVYLEAGDNLFFDADGSFYANVNDTYFVNSGSFSVSECDDCFISYNSDNNDDDCAWINDAANNVRMTLNQDGDLSIDGDMTADSYNDFGEYMESTEEFSKEKIPVGTTVMVEDGKIRPAKKGEQPIGVVSATTGIVLNGGATDCGNSWGKKYLRDDLGNYIKEEKEWWRAELIKKEAKNKKRIRVSGWKDRNKVPKGYKVIKRKKAIRRKINPEWDEKKKFIPRKERPEWNVIGFLGQVRILKGQPVASNWIFMKKISDKVNMYLIK